MIRKSTEVRAHLSFSRGYVHCRFVGEVYRLPSSAVVGANSTATATSDGLISEGLKCRTVNLDRQKGQGMESLSDRAISRIIEYLRNKGWSEKEINDFLEYIVRQ